MVQIFEIMFSGFWSFIGSIMLIGLMCRVTIEIVSKFTRMLQIRKHGWPPNHLDADGNSTDSELVKTIKEHYKKQNEG